ncbi:50S ribosomal protein L21e [Candidatus Pacearchaeota archaeon CG10_big_fil_rev_8_21_14_0_10_32_14]|nr:MAG: 50S ribosomal protein L21e [Candidatus Pacearchaeota archaeon CG10_big_fil_rev_8_21_14_0_10_32_14]
MGKRKSLRERGKIKHSEYFKSLNEGDIVSVVREDALQPRFPKRLQGRTGVVEGKRGRSLMVKIKDIDKVKRYIIEPIHLKKIKSSK